MSAAAHLIGLGRWAAQAYGRYDYAAVQQVVAAVAEAGLDGAEQFLQRAAPEAGPGVRGDRLARLRHSCAGLLAATAVPNWVDVRAGADLGIPQPLGVLVLDTASIPAACTAILHALMTRNAIVVSAGAGGAAHDAVVSLARAAVDAGAPEGIVQVADASMMAEVRADGGTALELREAVRGNVPAFVDASADLDHAAATLVSSAGFDQGEAPGCERVLIVQERVAAALRQKMEQALDGGSLRLAPMASVVAEEPLAHPAHGLVLGVVQVEDLGGGIRAARAALRLGPAGGSAVIHSRDQDAVLAYATEVSAAGAARVVVNDGGAPGGPELHPADPGALLTWTMLTGTAMAPKRLGHRLSGPIPDYPVAGTSRSRA